jgi:hypothetical protein
LPPHNATTLNTQALLARILQLPAEQLPRFVDEERERLTFGFLSYLSERARGGGEGAARRGAALSWGSGGSGGGSGAASSQERARLSELASRLVALREAAGGARAGASLPPPLGWHHACTHIRGPTTARVSSGFLPALRQALQPPFIPAAPHAARDVQIGSPPSGPCRRWRRPWPTPTTRPGGRATPGRSWLTWRRGSAWRTSTAPGRGR